MSTWLYPIAKRGGREFWLDDGTRLEVSVDNYAKLVKNGRLGEDELWGVATNFLNAQPDEEVFIYTGDQNLGIIGYAKIVKVELGKNPAFHLRFDLKKCASLLAAPVPAPIVRKWLRPRKTVENLTPHLSKLRQVLPWKISAAEQKREQTISQTAFRPEFFGQRKSYTLRGQIRGEAIHGKVINALHDVLKAKKIGQIRNDQGRDLFVLNSAGRLQFLFEAKTDLSTHSIYEAVGQLFYHSAGFTPLPKRVLVLPGKPSDKTQNILRKIGISTLRFEWSNKMPRFLNLGEVLKN
jgi:hypothetical protein